MQKFAVLLALLTAVPLTLMAERLTITPTESSQFVLEVHKTGLMSGKSHIFHFNRYRGELDYDKESPANSSIRLVIESASAECKDEWVKPKKLKDIEKYAFEDMMRVSEHPEIIFESTKISAGEASGFTVTGVLTIVGIAKPATISVNLEETGDALKFTGASVVSLNDYGIKPRRAALGTIGTKSEMNVTFTLFASGS